MMYLTQLVNQILNRRREHLEQRNDFIQIMVDHEEQMKHDEITDKQEQQWRTLKKSNDFKDDKSFDRFDFSSE